MYLMFKVKHMSLVWLMKIVWSPQATWTEICDFFTCKYLNTDIKKGEAAELFFKFSVLKYTF